MLTLTLGDTAPALSGKVNASLVGATATVHVKRPDRTVITRTATITDTAAGLWAMSWEDGDLNQTGAYAVEVEVTFSDQSVQTFAYEAPGRLVPAKFNVREQYA